MGYQIASRDPEVLGKVIAALTNLSPFHLTFCCYNTLFKEKTSLRGKRETLMLIKREILKIL